MTIPTRKYLISEHENGLGERHFTVSERRHFLGYHWWSTDYEYCLGMPMDPCRYQSFDLAVNRCAELSRYRAAHRWHVVRVQVIER